MIDFALSIPWWAWAVVAIVIGLAELHAPGSYFIWIALGAAATAAIDAAWGLSIEAQLETFAGAAALSCLCGYFVYRRFGRRHADDAPLNERDRLIIGTRGIVAEPFSNGRGKVRLGDSVWLAEGPDLSAGAPIVVKAVRGTLVIVDRA
jgi:membrane protein implicated in regulation of membrane protease activity